MRSRVRRILAMATLLVFAPVAITGAQVPCACDAGASAPADHMTSSMPGMDHGTPGAHTDHQAPPSQTPTGPHQHLPCSLPMSHGDCGGNFGCSTTAAARTANSWVGHSAQRQCPSAARQAGPDSTRPAPEPPPPRV